MGSQVFFHLGERVCPEPAVTYEHRRVSVKKPEGLKSQVLKKSVALPSQDRHGGRTDKDTPRSAPRKVHPQKRHSRVGNRIDIAADKVSAFLCKFAVGTHKGDGSVPKTHFELARYRIRMEPGSVYEFSVTYGSLACKSNAAFFFPDKSRIKKDADFSGPLNF